MDPGTTHSALQAKSPFPEPHMHCVCAAWVEREWWLELSPLVFMVVVFQELAEIFG